MINFLIFISTPALAGGYGGFFCRAAALRGKGTSRSFSSSTPKQSGDRPSFIPAPTWSMRSLDLTSKHAKLSPDEVDRLGHRSLLDLNQLPRILEQDLANMMHMVQQISDFVEETTNKELFTHGDTAGSVQYDSVRGVTAAPFRFADDPPDAEDLEEAAQVWGTYLDPKTIRQGGAHQYFVISTKQEEDTSK